MIRRFNFVSFMFFILIFLLGLTASFLRERVFSFATTTTDQMNVTLTVTSGGGGGGGGGDGGPPGGEGEPPPEEESDITPPFVPANFIAEYDSGDGDIDLSWQNPLDPDFALVRIMRSNTFFPQDEEDGDFIYEGGDEFFEDNNLIPGVTYYYSIFARDTTGNWSSGAVDDEVVPLTEEEPPPEEEEEPPAEEEPGPTEEILPDPFEQFPEILEVPEEIAAIDVLTFDFIQDDRRVIFSGQEVPINGQLPLTISVDYDKLPEVLKTIGVSIRHPRDPKKFFSFILRVDLRKQKYEAVLMPFFESGRYDFTITILDHKHQRLKRIKGAFEVSGGIFEGKPFLQFLHRMVSPIGQAVGIAAGLSQTVIIVSNVRSFYDFYLIVVRFFGAIFGFLGLRKKREPWGTVYDSVTKRPLDPAYVRVMEVAGDEVTDAITDLDGRYGFLLPRGAYRLVANKTNYAFPSKALVGKPSDELYENLYYGEPIVTAEGEVITRNIPLDPTGFDWNEFVKNKSKLFRIYSRRENMKAAVFNGFYLVGLASTIFSVLVSPGTFNFVVLGFYIALFLFQLFWRRRHRAIRVINNATREPIPFAIVRVYTAQLNEQVKAVVADELGRFFMLLSPGRYYFTVDAKQADGSYQKIYSSSEMNLKKGVITQNILINENPNL